MRTALQSRHFGHVIHAYRTHPWHSRDLTQQETATWLNMNQAALSRIENGRAPDEISKLTHWANILRIPPALLWFSLPPTHDPQATAPRTNRQLQRLRHARAWTPAETAERLRNHIHTTTGRRPSLDANAIERLELGEITHLPEIYRAALCAVYGLTNDDQLGLTNSPPTTAPPPPAVTPPQPEPDPAPPPRAPFRPNPRLRAHREQRHWTQEQAASAVAAAYTQTTGAPTPPGIDAAWIGRLERGRLRWPNPEHRTALRTTYGVQTDAELGLYGIRSRAEHGNLDDHEADNLVNARTLLIDEWWPEHTERLADRLINENPAMDASIALRLAHEWLITEPPQIVESRSGRRIGSGLITQIEDRIHQLRQMDDFIGGVDLHAAVAKELHTSVTLAKEATYDETTGRRLLTAIGELCQVAGWVASDAGYHDLAAKYYLDGTSAAHATGNLPIAANLLSSLSYQIANVGDPRTAATLAKTAAKGAGKEATPATRALLWERLAWAEAKAHEPSRCERALGTASDEFDVSQPQEEPPWIYWLDETEMNIMAGRCYTELSRPLRAEPLLRQAIEGYDESHTREVSLYLTWLAEDYIQAREIDQACAVATRAVNLANGVHSARSSERVAIIRRQLEPFHQSRAVRDFNDLFHDTTPTDD
jgi:transcriptional regulator with XRE-family HTH domain